MKKMLSIILAVLLMGCTLFSSAMGENATTFQVGEKYPSKELFFSLSYETYNTYMSASTYPYMATYPVASLSEEQLLKYADYYLDSCFNPMIYEDESLFREEAWRYVLASEEVLITSFINILQSGCWVCFCYVSDAVCYLFVRICFLCFRARIQCRNSDGKCKK